ncbi:MAG: 1-deoxy-D-xylulose-5-phosphate reductoisomerase [Bacteroidales bacterium]|nr:1-deoxy-D-xylulose-5-phosphate reductoisomerase [Bacteroidales bacterium]
MKKQNLAILGSTGSIGTQTLDVVAANPDLFAVYAITANNNVDLLIKQARTFHPEAVVVANEAHYNTLREALTDLPIKVFAGSDAVAQVAALPSVDTVVTAMVGYAGLKPTIEAVKAGKRIALANKETLVVAGELVTRLVQQHHAAILPVDSEHGAIFQCLVGENADEVEKIILTASGGPFRNKSREELASVTAKDALRHPTWQMGAKITIDSASLMNKGFEVIEAKWLFGLRPEQIDVVIHPQSIIHSMVQYRDGSIKAQLGVPDMRLPIEYALTFPQRRQTNFERLDFTKCSQLTFEQPDPTRFRNLALAFEAMRRGGNIPCALNAANEIAVDAFLHERIGFLQMSNLIETVLERTTFIATPSYNDYVACDTETRQLARKLIAHCS